MAKFNWVKWFLSAVSDDQTRPFMCKPYYDAEHKCLVATDGRRMHVISRDCGIAESTFVLLDKDGTANPVKWDYQFPNWKRVDTEYKTAPVGVCFNHPKISVTRFCVEIGVAFNYNYLKDLGNTENWEARCEDKNRAWEFRSGPFKAVIMPMQV